MTRDANFDHLVVMCAYRGDELVGRELCASQRELDDAVDRWRRHPRVHVFIDDVEYAGAIGSLLTEDAA